MTFARRAVAIAAGAALASCSRGAAPPASFAALPAANYRGAATPIEHIVVMVQENRTFNDLFATFPGTAGTTIGKEFVDGTTRQIALAKVHLESPNTLRHTYPAYKTAYRGGNMDAFNDIIYQSTGKPEGSAPYQYVDPNDVAPYWNIAKDYAIADRFFQTQGSGSFTAHQDLIRGDTQISATESLIDDPTLSPWGCPAEKTSKTSLITTALKYEKNKGPFPCTSSFPNAGKNYATLADLLDGNGVSWKYYTPAWQGKTGSHWNAFLVISSVYGNPKEWNAHISQPEKNILGDIDRGALPSMSWVIPDGINSDHSGYPSDTGPSWVANVVNAIGRSKYWKSTAVVILWDDWGGFYDEVKPPKVDRQGGRGFRVPLLVVSPYVARNTISHTTYEFGSVVRFIEDTWSLGRLGTTDQSSASIAGIFDFHQKPRPFIAIPSRRSRSYFLKQPPSGLPVDDE
ncbi:MAG TPA: alkaline phosphatase family protein [Candidatus Cybelea sp.]